MLEHCRHFTRAPSTLVQVCALVLFLTLALLGCDEAPPPVAAATPDAGTPCLPGQLTLADGACQPAGLPPGITPGLPADMPCPPGEDALDDGTCQKAGVPPSACAAGFLPDGKDGCEAILPVVPCPAGQMAIPGDTECHDVAFCGSGTWGDVPVEANTQFVDKAYMGGGSNGTQTKPWTTIQQAIDAAASGAIVAVAAGSYPENVAIDNKPVRLWGRCPTMVQIQGTDAAPGAVVISQANGTEIHRITITGTKQGVQASLSTGVLFEQVWVHDTGDAGFWIVNKSDITLRNSLIAKTNRYGVFIEGANATIETSVIRETQFDAQGMLGRGIQILNNLNANVAIHTCLIEQNHEAGVLVVGSSVTIEATVVRATLPSPQGLGGFGINLQYWGQRANATIHGSVVEQNNDVGVAVLGSDATIVATVIRETQLSTYGDRGNGIFAVDEAGQRSNVSVNGCLVEQNHDIGIVVAASDASIRATLVRETQPTALGKFGRGIQVQNNPQTGELADATIHACLVEKNHEIGVMVLGANATLEATKVRETQPNANGVAGRGIEIENAKSARPNVTIKASLVEQNHEVGVLVGAADATIHASVIRDNLPNSQGLFGRGIEISADYARRRANVALSACLIEKNYDTGLSVYGSDMTMEATVVRETLPDINGEGGRGLHIADHDKTGDRSNVAIHDCLVEQNQEVGVFVAGSDATVETTVVRGLPAGQNAQGGEGRGINVQNDPKTSERANVAVRTCLVEQSQGVGIFSALSDLTVENSLVRDTRATSEGYFGDGLFADSSSVTIQSTTITMNERAGVANFGSHIIVDRGVFTCNAFDINGEPGSAGEPFSFEGTEVSGWQCGDPSSQDCSAVGTCRVMSANLVPPKPVAPLPPSSP